MLRKKKYSQNGVASPKDAKNAQILPFKDRFLNTPVVSKCYIFWSCFSNKRKTFKWSVFKNNQSSICIYSGVRGVLKICVFLLLSKALRTPLVKDSILSLQTGIQKKTKTNLSSWLKLHEAPFANLRWVRGTQKFVYMRFLKHFLVEPYLWLFYDIYVVKC